MELKQSRGIIIDKVGILLIVPYGIETKPDWGVHKRDVLLIVPYGIETKVVR